MENNDYDQIIIQLNLNGVGVRNLSILKKDLEMISSDNGCDKSEVLIHLINDLLCPTETHQKNLME
jgi:hypothetical protein